MCEHETLSEKVIFRSKERILRTEEGSFGSKECVLRKN